MASNELKNLALIAKQRLKSAQYNTPKNYNGYNNRNNYFIKNISSMKKLSGNCEFVTITNKEDLQFLKKVHSMLSQSDEIYNPIGRLVDKEYYKTLNEAEQQLYVLTLAERYKVAKDEYNKVNAING